MKIENWKLKIGGGFTLIELLVAMAILGVLATVGLSSFRSSQIKARDAERKSDLSQVQKALEMFYNDNGAYPPTAEFPSGGGSWSAGGTLYMKTVPTDDKFGNYYYLSADGTSYQLYARLENVNDKDYCDGCYGETVCGDADCNYGVASSDIEP